MQRRVSLMQVGGGGRGSNSLGGVVTRTHGMIAATATSPSSGCLGGTSLCVPQQRHASAMAKREASLDKMSAAKKAKLGLLIPQSSHDQKLVRRYGHFKPGPALGAEAKKKIDALLRMQAEAAAVEAEGSNDLNSSSSAEKTKEAQQKEGKIKKAARDFGMTPEEYEAHLAKVAPRIIKMYPGDWFCTICNDLNTRIDIACRKCYTPAGFLSNSDAGAGRGAAQLHHFSKEKQRKVAMVFRNAEGKIERRDDWVCVKCETKNSRKTKKCRECDNHKQIGRVHRDWKCTVCQTPNFGARTDCVKCRTSRAKVASQLFGQEKVGSRKYHLSPQVDRNKRQRLMVLMGLKRLTAHDETLVAKTAKQMKKRNMWSEEKEEALKVNMVAVKIARQNVRKGRQEQQALKSALRMQYRYDGVKLVRTKDGQYTNVDGSPAVLREGFRKIGSGAVGVVGAKKPESLETSWRPPVAIAGGGTMPGIIGPLSGAPPLLGGYKGPTPEMIQEGIVPNDTAYGYAPDKRKQHFLKLAKIALAAKAVADGGSGAPTVTSTTAAAVTSKAEWDSPSTLREEGASDPKPRAVAPSVDQPVGGGYGGLAPNLGGTSFPEQADVSGGAPPQQRGFGAPPPHQRGFGASPPQQQEQQQPQGQPQQRGFGAPPTRGFGQRPSGY